MEEEFYGNMTEVPVYYTNTNQMYNQQIFHGNQYQWINQNNAGYVWAQNQISQNTGMMETQEAPESYYAPQQSYYPQTKTNFYSEGLTTDMYPPTIQSQYYNEQTYVEDNEDEEYIPGDEKEESWESEDDEGSGDVVTDEEEDYDPLANLDQYLKVRNNL